MPTPFTHLVVAQRLLTDDRVPGAARALLASERGAFLLGTIAADARVSSGIDREHTHFYAYNQSIVEPPWRVMLAKYPSLAQPRTAAQRAFVAGCVAHLVMDALWSQDMVRPYFVQREWAPQAHRLLMLNVLVIWMDERDYPRLEAWQRRALLSAQPDDWLPFIPDSDLREWRDFVGRQLPPEGQSATLQVLGERIGTRPDVLRQILDSLDATGELWANVPPEVVARLEARIYERARADMLAYLDLSARAGSP